MHAGTSAPAVPVTDVRWPPVATVAAHRPPAAGFPVVGSGSGLVRLEAAVKASQVTLVCAPPGAGKTVLAAAWARTVPEAVWLSLGRDDAWPGVFWWHLLCAVSSQLPEVDPSTWPSGPDVSGGPVVDALALALHDRAPGTTIVLDAVEQVEGAVLDDLDRLLTLTGDGLRLVIVTRTRPDLPLHRYRLEGRLEEIGFDDLRLDDAAVAALLAQHGLRVSSAALATLAKATEGWAAGVRLVALSLRDLGASEASEEQVRASFATADTLLADYLRAEVMNALAEPDRVLLRRLSVVDSFGPGLTEVVSGQPQDAASLTDLARRLPFMRRDPRDPDGFVLHSLLRAVLYDSLRVERPDEVLALHRSAAEWYAASGDTGAAVDQLLRAGDRRGALRMVVDSLAIADVLLPTPSGSRLAERLRGVTNLPDTSSAAVVDAALAWSAGELERATARMAAVTDATPGPAALSAALVRARLAAASGQTQATLTAVAAGRQELEGQPRSSAAANADALLRMAEASALFAAGVLDDAAALLRETLLCLTDGQLAQSRLDCLGRLALVEASRGRLARALELAGTAERLTGEDATLRAPAAALLARAWVAIERQELSRALHWVGKANRLDELRRDPMLASVSVLLRARSMRDRGDVSTARKLLVDGPPPVAPFLRAERGQERTRLGLTDPGASDVADHPAPRRPSVSTQVETLLLDAQRTCARGDAHAGRHLVIEALALAEPQRLRRPFTHAGPAVHAVMRSDAEVAARTDWLPLIDAVAEPSPRSTPPDRPAGVLLTDRELEVLRHLSEMLSTQEIGSAMFISVNTVRTHVRHILDKLSVTRRNEAVRRARAIGLL